MKTENMLFYDKKAKKVTNNSNVTEFSRTPEWSKSCDKRLEMFIKPFEFFLVLVFFKTYLKQSYCDSKLGNN